MTEISMTETLKTQWTNKDTETILTFGSIPPHPALSPEGRGERGEGKGEGRLRHLEIGDWKLFGIWGLELGI
jgi:hypothetical protein